MPPRPMSCARASLSFFLGAGIAGAAMLQRAHLKEDPAMHIPPHRCAQEDLGAKDIDLVVFGATGFTGRITVDYLASRLPMGLRWAIAGRGAPRLYLQRWTAGAEARSKIRQELRGWELQGAQRNLTDKTVKAPSVLRADLFDPSTLAAMTKRARTIISYVGPYEAMDGEMLIRAALQTCTHYVDISTETAWKAAMLARYGAVAAKRGVALVQSAGAMSLPSDLLALATAEAMAKDGKGPPDAVNVLYTKNNQWFTGSTLHSLRYAHKFHGVTSDPYALAPETPPAARVDKNVSGNMSLRFDTDLKVLALPFFFGESDCTLIRRSLSLRFPGRPVSVGAGTTATSMLKGAAFNAMSLSSPLLFPGQGPPDRILRDGSYTIEALAKREADGRRVHMTLNGAGDLGSSATAIMSVELAVGLALDGPAGGRGGYLTPATALEAGALRSRLEHAAGGKFMAIS